MSEGDGYGVDSPSTTADLLKAYTIINDCECVTHNSEGDGDGYGVDPPLKYHYPIKGQQDYTIIYFCIY